MNKSLNAFYRFCSNSKVSENALKSINQSFFSELKYKTKIPTEPLVVQAVLQSEDNIDTKIVQLLERLSLVDLDNEKALTILKDSIQFAKKIHSIDTTNIDPLYSVLEDYNLILRNDLVSDGNIKEDILKNAKIVDEDYFVAPPGNIPLQQVDKS